MSADIFAKQKTKSMLTEIPVIKDWADSRYKIRIGLKKKRFLSVPKILRIGMLNTIPRIMAKIDSDKLTIVVISNESRIPRKSNIFER